MSDLEMVLEANKTQFHKLVDYDPLKQKLFQFDFSEFNKEITAEEIADTPRFSRYIDNKLKNNNAAYGIGGYLENRVLYKRSSLFNHPATDGSPTTLFNEDSAESRTIHLGIDIWGPAKTPVYLPVNGVVHSFAFNDHFGDYGATIIMQHQLNGYTFYTLYGHVSLADLDHLQAGQPFTSGETIAHFGEPFENGNWPPHLHFQLICDMESRQGDYPGVCTPSETANYARNCPNPDIVLNMIRYV